MTLSVGGFGNNFAAPQRINSTQKRPKSFQATRSLCVRATKMATHARPGGCFLSGPIMLPRISGRVCCVCCWSQISQFALRWAANNPADRLNGAGAREKSERNRNIAPQPDIGAAVKSALFLSRSLQRLHNNQGRNKGGERAKTLLNASARSAIRI